MHKAGFEPRLLFATAVALLSACQPAAVRVVDLPGEGRASDVSVSLGPLAASGGVGGGSVRTDIASSSIDLPRYVPVRRYGDVFTVAGVNQQVIVEYGWDYRSGEVIETVYAAAGALLSRHAKPGYTLMFTDRELELAIALAREDLRLKSLLSQDDLNFYAGFPYREATQPACTVHSRCVHVIVSAGDGERHVAHAIVDLMKRSVVVPNLDPQRKPDPMPGKSG